jgi:hypothetical protein
MEMISPIGEGKVNNQNQNEQDDLNRFEKSLNKRWAIPIVSFAVILSTIAMVGLFVLIFSGITDAINIFLGQTIRW